MTERKWYNPSRSYPHLAIARAFSVPYGLVLRFSDLIEEKLSEEEAQQVFRDCEVVNRHQSDRPWEWEAAVSRAVRDLRHLREVGMEAYIRG